MTTTPGATSYLHSDGKKMVATVYSLVFARATSMAFKFIRNALDKLLGRRRAQRKARTYPQGHRGVAAGDLRPGRQDLSQENIDRWEELGGDEVAAFATGLAVMIVHSTNVKFVRYDPKRKELFVQFKKSRKYTGAYAYGNVSEDEAILFAQYQSKGGFIWDNLRVRGSKILHRKPYRRVSSANE